MNGAPGEIRTPDLLLRRLSKQPWSTLNQAVTAALEWPYTALLALTEHTLNTTARTPRQAVKHV